MDSFQHVTNPIWMTADHQVRAELRILYNIEANGSTEMVDNTLLNDGVLDSELKQKLSRENMLKLLGEHDIVVEPTLSTIEIFYVLSRFMKQHIIDMEGTFFNKDYLKHIQTTHVNEQRNEEGGAENKETIDSGVTATPEDKPIEADHSGKGVARAKKAKGLSSAK